MARLNPAPNKSGFGQPYILNHTSLHPASQETEKKLETTMIGLYRVVLGLCEENGKGNGNYYHGVI